MMSHIFHRMALAIGLSLTTMTFASTEDSTLATAVAGYRETPREFRLDGAVEAVNQTTVSAQTQGQIQEIRFDIDDYVEKDSIIILLNDTEQRARVMRSAADLKEAVARLNEAKDEHQRIQDIFAKKLVSASAMDKAEAALKSANARFEAGQASLIEAREQLKYAQVRAPYSGIVTHRHVEIGEVARPGQELMTGISLDQLRVSIDVPQSLIPKIRRNGKARVQLPDNGWIEATKLTIFPYADRASNTFRVRINLPAGTKDLFPGMFVKTAFVTGNKKELVIPHTAVVYRSEVTGVYVIDESNRVRLRRVRLGAPAVSGEIAILAGLDEGERVALDPIAAGVRLKAQRAELKHD